MARISQARILKWIAFPSPRDLPNPRIEPTSPSLVGGSFTTEHVITTQLVNMISNEKDTTAMQKAIKAYNNYNSSWKE